MGTRSLCTVQQNDWLGTSDLAGTAVKIDPLLPKITHGPVPNQASLILFWKAVPLFAECLSCSVTPALGTSGIRDKFLLISFSCVSSLMSA